MLYINFFIEVNSADKVENIINTLLKNLQSQIKNYKLSKTEIYEKVDNWYEIGCDIELHESNYEVVKQFLLMVSDKWNWNGGKSSAHSCSKTMNAKFINDKIKFVSCHIEY